MQYMEKRVQKSLHESCYSDLYRWNPFVCAADSSCFFTVTGLWYWVDNLYKCWYWRGFM